MKDNIETFNLIAKEHNGKCLSTEYINCRTKLKFQCQIGHVWESSPKNVKTLKSWCPICAGHIKLTLKEAKYVAKLKNGKCLSTKYINAKTKLLWECNKGHQWFAKYHSIDNGTWCPICNKSKGENFVAKFLIENKINFEEQKSFDDCIGKRKKLSFDFYLPNYNILIEYDGRQHFEVVNFYGCSIDKANKTFNEIIVNDKIKNNYCIQNNIPLIRISYKEKNIEEYLKIKLKELNILI